MRDVFLAVVMVGLWGSNYAVAKIGLEDVPPFLFMALRFLLTALILLPFVTWAPSQLRAIFVYAFIVGLVHFGGIFGALAVSDAATVIVVSQINVPISVMIATTLLGERMRVRYVVGIAVALSGVVLYMGVDGLQTNPIGIAYCLVGAAAWSVGTIWLKARISAPAMTVNFWMAIFAVPMLLCAGIAFGERPWEIAERLTLGAAASLLYQAVAIVIVGYGIWNMLVRKYDVASVAPLTLLVPVSGLLFAWLLLGERLTIREATGGLVTMVGVVILNVSWGRFAVLLSNGHRSGGSATMADGTDDHISRSARHVLRPAMVSAPSGRPRDGFVSHSTRKPS